MSAAHPLEPYVSGEERYVRFAEDVLGVTLAEVQKQILRAVTQNKHLIIVSGNGVGKSFAVSVLNLAFLYTNPNSTALMTSGSYSQMEESTWKPMKSLLKQARNNGVPLNGETKEAQPRIEFSDSPEHYFRCVSGRYPDNLEGRHNERVLVVVDEADKPDISMEHFDSAQSSITDDKDRMVVIGNPPREEGNSLYQLMNDPRWEVIQFSSFDSHNVQVDAGHVEGEKLPGLVDLKQIREDWESWNRSEFPGVEACMNLLERDEATGILTAAEGELDERFYRRRLGVIPADGSQSVRPFHTNDISSAENAWEAIEPGADVDYDAYGVDVARGGGDRTVIVGITEERVDVLASVESPGDHSVNKRLVERHVGDDTSVPVIIDAIGEGSGVADQLSRTYNVTRFKASEKASQRDKYHDKRTEALKEFGLWLDEGALEPQSELATECRAAARHIELTEKSLRGGVTWTATSKSDLKKSDSLGRSPDLLDAATLAAWGLHIEQAGEQAGFSFYSYS